MRFDRDELNMVYQYAASTKKDTLAGLKEILPYIKHGATKEIVESTVRKLESIPEEECSLLIRKIKEQMIAERDERIEQRSRVR